MEAIPKNVRLATLLLAAALAGCAGAHSSESKGMTTSGVVNLGPASDYPAGSVSTKWLKTYGIVVSNATGTIVAIRPVTTNADKPQPVTWDAKEFLFTGKDNAQYDQLGQPIKGEHKPLPAIQTMRGGDNTIQVDLTRLYAM